ncbi:SLC35F6 [Symbiodinium necroappetens]|uniref:SLC35F6 protein n=1 Tax=Symbiodinium necroappetens TaxID=1628268 RepID=A0A812V716_9DINO|nr:SLC35F6 [Symbiodinium necroappetens]
MVNKTALIVSFLGVITLGGVTNKFAYQIKDVGDPAYPAHYFKKPWFLELLMFIGMVMSFPLHWAIQACSKPKVADGSQSEPLLPEEVKDRGWKIRALIFLPAMGDLVGSILSFTGLVYISNSTAQMLGSSIIIMVAVNSYIFLGRRYNSIQYAGMFIVLSSLLIVGYAADMAARDKHPQGQPGASASEQAFGMFLCVLARVVNSIQFVLEEKVMGESGLHPFEVTGTEGVYGLLMTACVIMPILARIPGSDVGGVYENTEDSLLMIQRNGTLDLVLIFYLLGLWGLNALGMMVMKHLGSVFRAVSRNMQALFVWLIDMALFYGLGSTGFGYGPVGEPWNGTASWIQVVGFVFMTVGVFVYAYGNAVQQVKAAQQEELKGIPSPIPVAHSMRELALDLDEGMMPSPLAVIAAEFNEDNAFGEADASRGLRAGTFAVTAVVELRSSSPPSQRWRVSAKSCKFHATPKESAIRLDKASLPQQRLLDPCVDR